MASGTRPGTGPVYTVRTPRVVAARKLLSRKNRDDQRRFLAEGPQAVGEAIEAGAAVELFVVEQATRDHADLVRRAEQVGVPLSRVTSEALATVAETVHPQGLVAVCRQRDVSLDEALSRHPRLVAVLVDLRDPGNAGTVLRTADAAGAEAVIFAGETVDPYNGKCVRASAGSVFHVDLVRTRAREEAIAAIRAAGLVTIATVVRDAEDLGIVEARGDLAAPTAWLLGSEAHGLPATLAASADLRVRVPIHGRAESLNLAAAAAVCLYTSARVHRYPPPPAEADQ